MKSGYFALVLHAHLPFVRHPEYDYFLEEEWLFEAITECYIPLLNVFNSLEKDSVPFKVTLSLSPTLLSMLTDTHLQERYVCYLNRLIKLADMEINRNRFEPQFLNSARMYFKRFINSKDTFLNTYNSNLLNGFKDLYLKGKIDLITTSATHAYLPLFISNLNIVHAQIKFGCDEFERHFGNRPSGIWLPECGYTPELDEILKEEGIKYFFSEIHGVLFGDPFPKFGVYAPIYNQYGTAVFGRDPESSRQIWSAKEGYPGDPGYRDFYRDIGFDREFDYISPFIQPDGNRKFTGVKYYRITGRDNIKEPYDFSYAKELAKRDAEDFLQKKISQVKQIKEMTGKAPIIVAPFDAELFGHWWFEGPEWIDFFIRKIANQGEIELTTPQEYLKKFPVNQLCSPAQSSWGAYGYHDPWLDNNNKWIYPALHKAGDQMIHLVRNFPDANGVLERAINQAGRELMLAQSSDWAFIMKTGTSSEYAANRTKEHLSRFEKLYGDIMSGVIDEGWLNEIESRNNVFPKFNYRLFPVTLNVLPYSDEFMISLHP